MDKKYAFVTSCDDKYAIYAQVLVYSFIENNKWFNGDIIIIDCGISTENKELFSKLYHNIIFHSVNKTIYTKLINNFKGKHTFNDCVFYRFECFNLQGYDRVVYYDADVLIKNDIQMLFNIEHSIPCCMCVDIGIIPIKEKTDKPLLRGNEYLNGGFFSISPMLSNFRDTLIHIGENFPFNKDIRMLKGEFPDQDLLNYALLTTQVALLPICYNYFAIANSKKYLQGMFNEDAVEAKCIHYAAAKPLQKEIENSLNLCDYVWFYYYYKFIEKYGK